MDEPIVNARLTVTWSEPWDEKRARHLINLHEEELRLAKLASEDDAEAGEPQQEEYLTYAYSPALTEHGDERLVVLMVAVSEGNDLQFRLRVTPRPSGTPPEAVERINEKLGSRDRIKRLTAANRRKMPIGLHRIQVFLPESDWRCHLLPRDANEVENELASDLGAARCEQIGFRYPSGPSGLEEVAIIYLHEEQHFRMTVIARSLLQIGERRWLPSCDTVAELALARYFEAGTTC